MHGQRTADQHNQPYGCSRQGLTRFSGNILRGSDRAGRIVSAVVCCQRQEFALPAR